MLRDVEGGVGYMRRHVFTPTAIAILRRLADEGRSAAEIAEAIGSTPASVRVKCCHLKVRLRPGRSISSRPKTYQAQAQTLLVNMDQATYLNFRQKAAQMRISASKLARMLLDAIVASNIYEAVLDNRDYGPREERSPPARVLNPCRSAD
jgi:hypothetical protein